MLSLIRERCFAGIAHTQHAKHLLEVGQFVRYLKNDIAGRHE